MFCFLFYCSSGFVSFVILFRPRLIRTEVWSRDGVLLQTASRHSHPVDKYGLCGARLIKTYFVETDRSKVVRRRRTLTMTRLFLSGGHRHLRMFCARDVSTERALGRVQDLDAVASTICTSASCDGAPRGLGCVTWLVQHLSNTGDG
jgi:hypothetical protein